MNLSELIDTHRGGRSYAELERDCGGSPSKGRLQQMVRQPIKNFPDPPTVRALAGGLKVGEAAVVLAAAESLGLDVRSSRPRVVELLPGDADLLTERQAAAVAHLVSTIVQDAESVVAVDEEHEQTTTTEPDVASVLAARQRLVGELGAQFDGHWGDALVWVLASGDAGRFAHVLPDLLSLASDVGSDSAFADPGRAIQEPQLQAARHGQPSLRGVRLEQDEAGEGPDPEGPEHGA